MISEPVLKDLEGAKKTHKMMGIALETRQGVILGGTFVVYSLICYYLAGLFGIDTTTAAIAFCWIVPVAFVFAFVKRDGKHLDFWIERKYLAMARPGLLIHTQPDPDNPTKSLRNSVQRALPPEEFYYEMLPCKDGTYLVAFEVEPVGLSMVGETERQRVYAAAIELYNRIDFPIVEFVRSKEGSTARYTKRLRRAVSSSIGYEERKLGRYAERYLSFLEDTVPSYNIFERKGYLIVPYNPAREGLAGGGTSFIAELKKLFGFKQKPSEKDARKKQGEMEAAYQVLSGRAQVIHAGFQRMGCRINVLTGVELTSFLKEQTTQWDPDGDLPVNLYSPVTLEHGGYELLSEEDRAKMARAADEVRDEASIAFAAGELSVAEKIAPDTVRIFPDYLRVEGRYHTTLYVSEWADEVYFGMLEALTHIEGRIKLVKYITPQPKEKALKILGAVLASLRAATRTANDGDIRSSEQRDISLFTNEAAMRELICDRQRYLELSTLIHVEADTEEELSGKVNEVRTTLSQYRTEAKLCREEAWEGFLSCLPLGTLYNKERYTRRGMLSNPLACLFSFGTHQIDHERGVFVGVDQASGSLITLNNRDLMNPHSVIIGQSGGGKTFVVKCLATRQRMLGRRIVIVDPESNSKYAKVAREIGGEFALIAPGSPHKINPFDLHDDYLNIDLLDDASMEADGEGSEDAFARARAAALDGKAQELTRTVSLMMSSDSKKEEGLSGAEAGYVERAIYEAYARKGIIKDPSTHRNEPPTFVDFFGILAELAEENREVAALYEKLYSWHSGALSTLFDSQTNVDLSNKFLVFQISKVKGRQKAPVYHSVLEFMNGILSNPDEPADCYMDEFASILKDPMAAEFAETMYRSARARNCGMCAISQQPIEFFASDHGRVILALSATHMIFRHEQRQPATVTASYYDFSEEETTGLLNLQPGEGYLVVGQTRIPLKVMGSPEEEELFNTKPKPREEAWDGYSNVSSSPVRPDLSGSPEDSRSASARRPAPSEVSGSSGWRPYGSGPAPGERSYQEEPEEAGDRLSTDHLAVALPWKGSPTKVYAFVGEGAAGAAGRVARLFADAAKGTGALVLAVDAAGGDVFRELSNEEPVPPDPYLRNGVPDLEALGPYIGAVPGLKTLKISPPPEDGNLSAFALSEAAAEIFNMVVVACSSDSSYAADWLREADRVVACSEDPGADDALESAVRAEELRGENGTLLCTSAEIARPRGAGPLYEPQLDGRRLFSLGGAFGERVSMELAVALTSPPAEHAPARQTTEPEHEEDIS